MMECTEEEFEKVLEMSNEITRLFIKNKINIGMGLCVFYMQFSTLLTEGLIDEEELREFYRWVVTNSELKKKTFKNEQ